jgi:alpha-tubulin suppressor-like RCC1 family protein
LHKNIHKKKNLDLNENTFIPIELRVVFNCNKHKLEYKFFCTTCEIITCAECGFSSLHKNHTNTIIKIQDINIENLKENKELFINEKLNNIENKINDIENENNGLLNQISVLQNKINLNNQKNNKNLANLQKLLNIKYLSIEKQTIKYLYYFNLFFNNENNYENNYKNKIFTFGLNDKGQLGLGKLLNIKKGDKKNRSTPHELIFFHDKNIYDIVSNCDHSFALTNDSKIYAFGLNDQGQLGVDDLDDKETPIEINIFNEKNIIQLSCGEYHLLALTSKHIF